MVMGRSILPMAAMAMALVTSHPHSSLSAAAAALPLAWSLNSSSVPSSSHRHRSNSSSSSSSSPTSRVRRSHASPPFAVYNVRSRVRRLSTPRTSSPSSSSSSLLLSSSSDSHAASSYETWGDGKLIPETFVELYSPSSSSSLHNNDSTNKRHRRRKEGTTTPYLPEWLLERTTNLGYYNPTLMQRLALDVLLPRMEISNSVSIDNNNTNEEDDVQDERDEVDDEKEHDIDNISEFDEQQDVILHAQTGSGKTLAYLLPTICDVDPSRQTMQAVIIVPTRELGLQVVKIARRLAGGGGSGSGGVGTDAHVDEAEDGEDEDEDAFDEEEDYEQNNAATSDNIDATTETTTTSKIRRKKIIIMPILQGSTNARVRGWAKSEPPHIVVGTPEELYGLLSRFVKRDNDDFVKSVSTVVVDEVDACLSSWRGGGGGGGGGQQPGGALHEVLSKYLNPRSVDHYRDGSDDDIDNGDFNNGRRRRRHRREATTQSQQLQQRRRRRTIFASATIPQHHHFAKSCVRNGWTLQEPTILTVGAGPGATVGAVPPTLEHTYVVCKDVNSKMGGLRRWMKKELLRGNEKESSIIRNKSKKVLIFCNDSKPRQLEELAQALSEDWNGVMWNEGSSSSNVGGKNDDNYDAVISVLRLSDTPGARAAAMAGFRGPFVSTIGMGRGLPGVGMEEAVVVGGDGKLRILLSTDLVARGLDVPDVTHVVNFDLPGGGGGDWYDAYVHRGGRAGRLGRKGKVMTLITPEEEFVMGRLANRLSLDLKCVARQVAVS